MTKAFYELIDPKLYLLEERTRTIATLLGVAAVLLGLGIIFGNDIQNHVVAMTHTMPKILWVLCLVIYAAIKVHPNTNLKTNVAAAVFGLWLWTYLFLTFVVLDTASNSPLEYMLMLPILLESWEFTLYVVNIRLTKNWRKHEHDL